MTRSIPLRIKTYKGSLERIVQNRVRPVLVDALQAIEVVPSAVEGSHDISRKVMVVSFLPTVAKGEEVLDRIGEPELELSAGHEAVWVAGWTGAADDQRGQDGGENGYMRSQSGQVYTSRVSLVEDTHL